MKNTSCTLRLSQVTGCSFPRQTNFTTAPCRQPSMASAAAITSYSVFWYAGFVFSDKSALILQYKLGSGSRRLSCASQPARFALENSGVVKTSTWRPAAGHLSDVHPRCVPWKHVYDVGISKGIVPVDNIAKPGGIGNLSSDLASLVSFYFQSNRKDALFCCHIFRHNAYNLRCEL